ncbi:MAG TPA: SDR family oxidoreductase [bacterium]|nr:SDR family oxidoreductase [bacterium]
MNHALEGRIALVTGGGTGIGRAITRALAASGAAVVINYSRSEADAEETAALIRAEGGRALAVRADVARLSEVESMMTSVFREFGRLDVLVNNAGTTKFVDRTDLDGLTEDMWDRILAVNVKGTFFVSRAAAKVMNEGRIINIGSVAAISGAGSSIAYAASKGAIHTMTRSLARALAPRITVNAIAPGLIDTRWHAGRETQNASRIPGFLSKRIGRPDDIAHIALALATADNFITGQVIVVDGGANF